MSFPSSATRVDRGCRPTGTGRIACAVSRAATLALLIAGGCATPPPAEPATMRLENAEAYRTAFDAAVVVARREGLSPEFRDRRYGVIETGPARAASLLEPWDYRGDSATILGESTLSNQRRRARFEFFPLDADGDREDVITIDRTLLGPDLLAVDERPLDLTAYDGPMELRVWVYLERQHRPGVRESRWTLSKTSYSKVIPAEGDSLSEPVYWTPFSRDERFEHRLLTLVAETIERGDPVSPGDADGTGPGFDPWTDPGD